MPHWTEGWDAVLHPMPLRRFRLEHWERAPLHLSGRGAALYDGLLGVDDIDRVVATQGIGFPALRIVRDHVTVPPDQWAVPRLEWGAGAVEGFAKPQVVFDLVRKGHSLVFDQMHRIWAPLAQLNRACEIALGMRATCNVYFTPGGARTFKPHYDVQDVFVLQLAGRKRWQVWEAEVVLPLKHQSCPSRGCEPKGLLLDVVLEPGDLLFFPRGYTHAAQALDQDSLHVSVSAQPLTWHDLLSEVVARFDDPLLHEAVPYDPRAPELTEAQKRRFAEVLGRLVAEARPSDALATTSRKMVSSRFPAVRGMLHDRQRAAELTLRTPLRRREGLMYQILVRPQDCQLIFHESVLTFGRGSHELLRWMAEASGFCAAELPLPTDQARLDLARGLLTEGFLQVG